MAVFITGATGCVGQYLVEALLAETDEGLRLLVRTPDKLPRAVQDDRRVEIVRADLADRHIDLPDLAGIDTAILVATAWGGAEAQRVIRDANLSLADRLIAAGCRRILYFSTASVLDRELALLPVAQQHGTDYIKGKYALTEGMERRAGAAEIVGLFPTLVVGGHSDGVKPLSHFGGLLHQVRPWMRAIRFLDAEARLHIVHAADIASVCVHLAGQSTAAIGTSRIVLGNPASTLDELIRDYTAHLGLKRRALIRLRPSWAEPLIRLGRIRLSPWDRHCMAHPDQSYASAVNPADFGRPVHMPDLRAGLRDIGVPPER